jgi:hypothetical protein
VRAVVGSRSLQAYESLFLELGFTVKVVSDTQKETYVDDLLVAAITNEHLSMMLAKRRKNEVTFVIVSGDGNSNNSSPNIRAAVERVVGLNEGYHVEMWSWISSLSQAYKRWAAATSTLKIFYLDDYHGKITTTCAIPSNYNITGNVSNINKNNNSNNNFTTNNSNNNNNSNSGNYHNNFYRNDNVSILL